MNRTVTVDDDGYIHYRGWLLDTPGDWSIGRTKDANEIPEGCFDLLEDALTRVDELEDSAVRFGTWIAVWRADDGTIGTVRFNNEAAAHQEMEWHHQQARDCYVAYLSGQSGQVIHG